MSKENTRSIDLELGASIIDGDKNLALVMLTKLVGSFATFQKTIESDRNKKAWNDLKDQMHKLKSGAVYCGVPILHSLLSNAEKIVASEDEKLIEALCKKIFTELKTIQNELETL